MPDTNPEPMINAVLAALEAKESAMLGNWLLGAILLIGVLLALLVVYGVKKLEDISKQTDGMKDELVAATRALGLLEGELKGRADQKKEDLK